MSNPTRSVFEGFPKTVETTKNNEEKVIIVNAKAISPLLAKIADFMTKHSTIFAGITCISLAAYNAHETGYIFTSKEQWQYAGLATLPALTFAGLHFGLYHLFRSHVEIEFSDDLITIKTLFKTYIFDRKQRHKFTAREHRKTKKENESLRLKASKRRVRWWSLPFKHYYSDAYELAFEHMGQRTVIMSIFKHKTMEMILNRLVACDEIIEGYCQKGSGQSLTPEGDWSEQSGDLHDTF